MAINNIVYGTLYTISVITTLLFLSLLVVLVNVFTYNKIRNFHLFETATKDSKWNIFLTLNRHFRITDISESFLSDLGVKKNKVIGRDFFSIINTKLLIQKVNGIRVTNQYLKEEYERTTDKLVLERRISEELEYKNYKGDIVYLHVIKQPILLFNMFNGICLIGEKRNSSDMIEIEKELASEKMFSTSLRLKLEGILSLDLDEGLFVLDLDNGQIFLCEGIKKQLNIIHDEAEISLNTMYKNRIENNDYIKLNSLRDNLVREQDSYSISYRYKISSSHTIIIKETGRRLFDDESGSYIVGFLKVEHTNHFSRSGIEVLDGLPALEELESHMDILISKGTPFFLTIFEFSNLEDINSKHGYKYGNMALKYFVEALKSLYPSENDKIYRLSGKRFSMPITNTLNMEKLRFQQTNKLSNSFSFSIGTLNFTIIPHIGVIEYTSFNNEPDKLIERAEAALELTYNSSFCNNICFYTSKHQKP